MGRLQTLMLMTGSMASEGLDAHSNQESDMGRHLYIGFREDLDIPLFIEMLEASLSDARWIFVARDSSRGDRLIEEIPAMVQSHARKGIELEPSEFGFWVDGVELRRISSELVPYTAAYVFPKDALVEAKPPYDETSEVELFEGRVPIALVQYVLNQGALGYVADGEGLNYLLADDALAKAILADETVT
jgi:hypothetical protein